MIRAPKYSPQAAKAMSSPTVVSPGQTMGSTTRHNVPSLLQPSIQAASSNSRGTSMKYSLINQTVNGRRPVKYARMRPGVGVQQPYVQVDDVEGEKEDRRREDVDQDEPAIDEPRPGDVGTSERITGRHPEDERNESREHGLDGGMTYIGQELAVGKGREAGAGRRRGEIWRYLERTAGGLVAVKRARTGAG